jgi:hypothetical protein
MSTTRAKYKSLRNFDWKYPSIMAVSIRGHNDEGARRAVDKKKLVDMQENNSKTRPTEERSNKIKYDVGTAYMLRLRFYDLALLSGDLVDLSQVGMIQISVKCLCLRSCPWSSASISRSLFGSSSGWVVASDWCLHAWW